MKDMKDFKEVIFKEGETYLSKSGKRVTVIRNNLSGDYPVLGVDDRKILHKYTEKGRAISNSFSSEDDLIMR